MPVLEATDVHIVYGHGTRAHHAVQGVGFRLPESGTLGIAGESGSGKSSLAKAMVGLVEPAAGTISWDGVPLEMMPKRGVGSRSRTLQMVFQDPTSSLNQRMTAGDTIDEALAVNGFQGDRRGEVRRLLDLVGIGAQARDKYPFQFSGGQRQRIALARALAPRPSVLVCDEMTSALDVSVQAAILNLVRSICDETGLGLIVISHNLDVIHYLCDDLMIMKDGHVIETGPTAEVLAAPSTDYARQLLAAVPRFAVTPGVYRSSSEADA